MKVKIFNSRDECHNCQSTAEYRIRNMEDSLNGFLSKNKYLVVKHVTTQSIDKDLAITIIYDFEK